MDETFRQTTEARAFGMLVGIVTTSIILAFRVYRDPLAQLGLRTLFGRRGDR